MSQDFAETLKQLRIENGLSKQALAEKMLVTRSTINRWENGTRLPDAVLMKRLADILDADINHNLSVVSDNNECPNVIIVDDIKMFLLECLPILEEVMSGANIVGFVGAEETIEYARNNSVSLAFLDIELRNASGLDLCRDLLAISPRTNVVYLTAYSDYALNAWSTGASGFMLKPLTVEGVKEQLKNLRYPFYIGGDGE